MIMADFRISTLKGPKIWLDSETLQTIINLAMEGLKNCEIDSNGLLLESEQSAMGVINDLRRCYPCLVED